MRVMTFRTFSFFAVVAMSIVTCTPPLRAESTERAHRSTASGTARLWAHDNLYVWDVVDSRKRGPDERAQMLESLGFKHYAYFSGSEVLTGSTRHEFKDIHGDPDTQITALQRHGIDVVAWYFWDGAENPQVRAAFELFRRHNIHPQIWISQDYGWVAPEGSGTLRVPTHEEWQRVLSGNVSEFFKLNEEELPNTNKAQQQRVMQEASRIKALAQLAERYGCTVALYNHDGRWFGNEENELAIVNYLEQIGVMNVGLVYNFSHAIDFANVERDYDDSKNFAQLWGKIKSHVVAVNITAVGGDGIDLSQGTSELEMMRIIQQSGWTGPIGVEVHHGGDAAIILRNDLIALDWLAAELMRPGSAGPRPQLRDAGLGETN